MRKRYSITMDAEIHRRLTLEAVRQGKPLGEYIGGLMDEPIRKAIAPEAIKVQPDGKLSKGLGPLPGQPTRPDVGKVLEEVARPMPSFAQFRPAPKPGKGKS